MNIRYHTTGLSILIGTLLMAAATLLHPLTINPANQAYNLNQAARYMPVWDYSHGLLLVALTLWLGGLATVWFGQREPGPVPRLAGGFFFCALSVWAVTLSSELGALPAVVRELQRQENTTLRVVGGSLFAFDLVAGYVAMTFAWLGIVCLSFAARHACQPKWFSSWGTIGGCLGAAGMIYSLIWPSSALIVLIVSSLIPYLWTVILGWRLLITPSR